VLFGLLQSPLEVILRNGMISGGHRDRSKAGMNSVGT